jgi:hypothetical protein
MKKTVTLRFGVISAIVFLAAMSRLLPHPPNFAPVCGIALFGAAYYAKRYCAFLIPLAAMWISDLALNNLVYKQYFDGFVWFFDGAIFTYLAFALIVVLGMFALKKVRVINIVLATISASVIFFAVSNFGVWLSWDMYPHTFNGLVSCYIAGLPFFKNTIAGDFVYTTLLFGVFEYSVKRFPKLQNSVVSK